MYFSEELLNTASMVLLYFLTRDSIFPIPNGMANTNTYSIEWKKDTIKWFLNDQPLRTYSKSGPEADSQFLPGTRFFPDRPQKVQFAVWSNAGNAWSGGIDLILKS